jgi:hypothetical protein
MSHGYSASGGEKSQGNAVMYHHCNIPESKTSEVQRFGW